MTGPLHACMRALDLYCGLGGWSDGLAFEGFDVLGVEIERKIARLYKHACIVADVRTLDGARFKGFDLIVGSPPCRDFSQLPDRSTTRKGVRRAWKTPKDPLRGLTLVYAFLRIVREAQPRYWLMENVPGLKRHLKVEPMVITRLSRGMRRAFWGEFPGFLIVRDFTLPLKDRIRGPHRRWKRACIPLRVARALGKAIKESMQPSITSDE